ncbi:MAG: ABC transporter ATP-binding protein [Pirellulaceae bacterium]
MSPQIRLKNVTKQFGASRALAGVTLEIGAGVTGLLGPNGAGKTTLIKVLLGLVRATSGEAEVLGFRLPGYARHVRSRVGYLPEDDCYVGGLTGIEMVQYMARLAGYPAVESLRRSHEMLDYCGLRQERYRDVATYSTGMRQKLKFAQAIVHDPPLLILDEPTTGLDPEERVAMLGRIRHMASQAGKTVVLSTHILPDVQATCDHVVIMARGRVQLADAMARLIYRTTSSVEVRVLDSPARFTAEARHAGLTVQEDGEGRLQISGLPAEGASLVWQCADRAGTALTVITPVRTPLEQTFRDAIEEAGRANS